MKKTLISVALLAATLVSTSSQAQDLPMDVKLLGMVLYLQDGGCPGLKPNMAMFGATINKYGSLDEMQRNPGKMRAAGLFAEVLKNQNPASCTSVREGFGPNGTTIPGLATY